MKTVAWIDPYLGLVLTDRQLQTAVAQGEPTSTHLVGLCYQSDLVEAYCELHDMVQKSKEMVQKSRDLICELESVREEIKSLQSLLING